MGMAVPIDLSRRTPTESDTSGSNFSRDGQMAVDDEDDEDDSIVSNNEGPPAGQTDEDDDDDQANSEEVSDDVADADENPIDHKGKGVDPRERGVIHGRDAGGDPDDEPSSDDNSDDGSEGGGEDEKTDEGEDDDAEKVAAGKLILFYIKRTFLSLHYSRQVKEKGWTDAKCAPSRGRTSSRQDRSPN